MEYERSFARSPGSGSLSCFEVLHGIRGIVASATGSAFASVLSTPEERTVTHLDEACLGLHSSRGVCSGR